jgi:hypothetical protein
MLKVFILTLIFFHVCQGGELLPGTVDIPLTDCTEGMISDGKGGCIYTSTTSIETLTTTTIQTTTTIIIDCLPGFIRNDRGDECVFQDCDYFNQIIDWNGWFYEAFGSIYERYGCITTTMTTTGTTLKMIVDCLPGFKANEKGNDCVFLGCDYIYQNSNWYGWYKEPLGSIYERYGCTTTKIRTTAITTTIIVDCFLPGFTINDKGDDCDFLGCDYINQIGGWYGWYYASDYYYIYERYGCTTTTMTTTETTTTTILETIIIDCLPGFKVNDRGDNCVFQNCDYFNQVIDWNG